MQEPEQQILLSECHSCSWGKAGYCVGPRNARTYLMQGDNYTTCLNTEKRELMFSDTFKNFPQLPVDEIKTIELPNFVPTAVRSKMKISDEFEDVTFGISLGKITGKRGDISYADVDKIKESFGLPANSKIALICTSADQRLENLWKIHETRRIFERIAEMGFVWVTSLTYSVWQEDFPRPDQLKNQWRNFRSYDAFTSLGLPCIPFLFPVEDCDFENTAKWLSERPAINTIAVYARYYHSEEKFQWFCSFMKKIERLAQRKIRFLVCGIGKGENIARLKERYDCCFENSKMFEKTIHGTICDSKLTYSRSFLSKEDLFRINLTRNTEFCEPKSGRPIIYLKNPNHLIPVGEKSLGLSK